MKYSIITIKNDEEISKIKEAIDMYDAAYDRKVKFEVSKTILESGNETSKIILEGESKDIDFILEYINSTMSDNKKVTSEKKNSITLLPNNTIKVLEAKENIYYNYELDDILMRHDLQ